jgi:hypothetical protein
MVFDLFVIGPYYYTGVSIINEPRAMVMAVMEESIAEAQP